jgi:hypothetical protein
MRGRGGGCAGGRVEAPVNRPRGPGSWTARVKCEPGLVGAEAAEAAGGADGARVAAAPAGPFAPCGAWLYPLYGVHLRCTGCT